MAFKEEEKYPSIDDNFADDGNGTGSDDSGTTVDPDKDHMVFLTFPMINLSECGSCIFAEYNACVKSCPYDAISYDSINKSCVISQKNCAAASCGQPCVDACPKGAITYQNIGRPSKQEGAVKNTLVCFNCEGYEECISSCPANAITRDGFYCVVDPDACIDCGMCEDLCPKNNISISLLNLVGGGTDDDDDSGNDDGGNDGGNDSGNDDGGNNGGNDGGNDSGNDDSGNDDGNGGGGDDSGNDDGGDDGGNDDGGNDGGNDDGGDDSGNDDDGNNNFGPGIGGNIDLSNLAVTNSVSGNISIKGPVYVKMVHNESLALRTAMQIYCYADMDKIQNPEDFARKCIKFGEAFEKTYNNYLEKNPLAKPDEPSEPFKDPDAPADEANAIATSKKEFYVDCLAGSTTFLVSCKDQVKVSHDTNWLTVTPNISKGTGKPEKFTIEYDLNKKSEARTGTIKVESKSVTTEIPFAQEAYDESVVPTDPEDALTTEVQIDHIEGEDKVVVTLLSLSKAAKEYINDGNDVYLGIEAYHPNGKYGKGKGQTTPLVCELSNAMLLSDGQLDLKLGSSVEIPVRPSCRLRRTFSTTKKRVSAFEMRLKVRPTFRDKKSGLQPVEWFERKTDFSDGINIKYNYKKQ